MSDSIGVLGMGVYLPFGEITNAEVARHAGVTEDWIMRATGIQTRYTAAPDEAASDLGINALQAALEASNLVADDLDLIIVATSTPDELGPATACRVQEDVRATSAVAFDLNAACSGWLFGASVARGWLATRTSARYAAIVTVDTYTKFLNLEDRSTACLFSDGAVATIIGNVGSGGFQDIQLWSDGSIADSILIPSGGSRNPVMSADSNKLQQIYMDGKAIRDFAYKVFPEAVQTVLANNEMTLDDIDAVVAHQPNPVLLKWLAEYIQIPPEKLVVTGDKVGNIGCACTPYALAVAAEQKTIKAGDRVLMCAFGAGMTWAGALLTCSGAPVVRAGSTTAQKAA